MPADRGKSPREEETHIGKSQSCVECGKVFNRNYDLKRHEKTHKYKKGDIKQFKCERDPNCSFSAHQRSNLEAHHNMHDNKKPHACEECDFASGDRASLIRHKKQKHNYVPRARKASSPLPEASEAGPSNAKREVYNPDVPANLRRMINKDSEAPAMAMDQFKRFPAVSSPSPPTTPTHFDVPSLSRSSSASSFSSMPSNYEPATLVDLPATPSQPLRYSQLSPSAAFCQDQQFVDFMNWSWNKEMYDRELAANGVQVMSGNAYVDDKSFPGTQSASNLATNPAIDTTGFLWESQAELINQNAFAPQPTYNRQYQYQDKARSPAPYYQIKAEIPSPVVPLSSLVPDASFHVTYGYADSNKFTNPYLEANQNLFGQSTAHLFLGLAAQMVPTMEPVAAYPQFDYTPVQFEPQVQHIQQEFYGWEGDDDMSKFINWNAFT